MTDTDETAKKPLLNGGLDPAEMARRSWEKRRERAAAAAAADEDEPSVEDAGKVIVVRTTIEIGAIMKKLERSAKRGDVRAAAELRNWMREVKVESDTDMSVLDSRTRQEVIARVLADIERDEGQIPDGPLVDDRPSQVRVTSL